MFTQTTSSFKSEFGRCMLCSLKNRPSENKNKCAWTTLSLCKSNNGRKEKKKKKRYASIWRALLTHSARPFASNRKQAHSFNAICKISTTCAKLIIVTWNLELNLPLKTLELEEVKSNASSHVKDIHVWVQMHVS